jgi:hypothetical protein
MDRAVKNTPTHPAWSTVYARNVICELSPRRQHKVKTVTLSIVDETMVERFERLQMDLHMTTDGWHNPYLTKMFNAHINVEVFAGIWSVKYLFKYVYKGPDHVVAVITDPTNEI